MKRFLIIIFSYFGLISYINGQEVNVTASFDTSKIFIGDQIRFTITVDQPNDLKVTLPYFKDTICKNIEIIAGPLIDSSTIQDGRLKVVENYLITSFDSGYYQVPPVFAEIKNDNGLKRYYSGYSLLEVMRVKIAPADTTAKIYDIISPYHAPLTIGEILPWILICALIAAIVWAAIKYLPRLKRDKTIIEEVINPDPAHIIAFRELERLKQEELWQKGDIKGYYSRLTEILRQYLENRYRVYSLELTTSETLDALLKTGFKKDGMYNQLKNVLSSADLVKFAKYSPEPTDNEAYFQGSWDFIAVTKETDELAVVVNANKNKEEEQK